jgi:hypothetical protein
MKRNILIRSAGLAWLAIGLMLIIRGGGMIFKAHAEEHRSLWWLLLAVCLGLLMGVFKGTFMLKKSARKNRKRLETLPEPLRFWQIFPPFVYPLIPLMIGMGLGLKYFAARSLLPGTWTTAGAIYIGIGMALFSSSFCYFQKKSLA